MARRKRPAKTEGLQNAAQSRGGPEPDAGHLRSNKKSPCLGSVAKLAEAWGAAQLHPNGRRVAKYFAKAAGTLTLDELTEQTPNALIAGWRAEGYARDTVYGYRSYVRRLLRVMVESGAHPDCEKLLAKVPAYKPRTIIAEGDEADRMMTATEKIPWLRAFLIIAIGHGLRFAEIRRLARCHYNQRDGTISYPTKGGRTNSLPVSDELAELFATAPRGVLHSDPLIDLIRGKHLSNTTVRHHWRSLLRRAGVNPNLRPHDMRRTLAVTTMDTTKDIRVVQALLGHESAATTALYLQHMDKDKMRETLREVMPIGLRKKLEQKGAYFGTPKYQN